MQFTPYSKKRNLTLLFIVLSLFLHLSVFFLIYLGLDRFAYRKSREEKTFWVQLKKAPEEPLKIADIPKPVKEEPPDKANAESLYNQKVKNETVAKSPLLKLKKGTSQTEPTQNTPKIEEKKVASLPSKDRFSELYGKKSERRVHTPGIPDGPQDGYSLGTADDFLPHFKMGNRTYINTQANPQIQYFVELKRKFRLTFNPSPVLASRINEISKGQISVVLGVSLNRSGNLVELITIRSSGIPAYDGEGRRTVQSSSPFSAPPAHLMGSDGLLHMAWTFIVYL